MMIDRLDRQTWKGIYLEATKDSMIRKYYRDPKTGRFLSKASGGVERRLEIVERPKTKTKTTKIVKTKYSGNYVMQEGRVIREEDAPGPRQTLPREWMTTSARRRMYQAAYKELHDTRYTQHTDQLIQNIQVGHGVDSREAERIAVRVIAQERFSMEIDDIQVSPKGQLRLW